jgi:hypothetical protein
VKYSSILTQLELDYVSSAPWDALETLCGNPDSGMPHGYVRGSSLSESQEASLLMDRTRFGFSTTSDDSILFSSYFSDLGGYVNRANPSSTKESANKESVSS